MFQKVDWFFGRNSFIGTSPDSNVDCSCCGSGLLEVKCSSSIKREKPSHENISFLTLGENDKITLKQSHPFFYQVRGQMSVTGKNHCGSFVYTHFGIHQERITLNPEFWKNILQTLQQFWYNFLAQILGTNFKLSLINQKYIPKKMILILHLFQIF